MSTMSFEEAKAELIACAVGAHDYEELETWEEVVDAAAFEERMAADRASRLQTVIIRAPDGSDDQ